MVNIFLFLSVLFLLTFLFGRLMEKIKMPWVFSALILGSFLAFYNPFSSITSSSTFVFLANLGMYFLLFMIGLEIDLKELKTQSKFIVSSTFFIIFFEMVFGSLIVHFVFGYNWVISLIVALSFATVGEAILIPILDEFKIVNTKLGQMIIGIGTLDDIIEVVALIMAVVLIGSSIHSNVNIGMILFSLLVLFILAMGLTKLKREGEKFKFLNIETLFLFTLSILFLFLGVGDYADSAPLAALLAGICLKTFIPTERLKLIESEIKTMTYGFFAPIFFLWAGSVMDMQYLFTYPLLILLVVLVSKGAKLLGTYIVAHKKIGVKKSILLGLGLSVRFSTSIIIIKILFDSGLITAGLYSVIIASSIIFNLIIPLVFSHLLVRWNIVKSKKV
ncbi:MAG: cation:proton antiporter [Candidatus Aenigmarchaeota archaeon]|nr:cation:proton antiporter [Candidatus Aenigmarchaeota archaeon]